MKVALGLVSTRLAERRGLSMRSITVYMILGSLVAVRVLAQDPAPTPTPPPAESVTAMLPPAPAPPNPLQTKYLQGLRTASRGVAQIKAGVSRVVRTQTTNDTVRAHVAAKRLGALCGAARGFITSGRGQMEPTAFEAPTRKPARDLALQLDSLSLSAKACQLSAAKTPAPVTKDLQGRLRNYETAEAAFRTAIGLPNR
jgi:hypothetical protein